MKDKLAKAIHIKPSIRLSSILVLFLSCTLLMFAGISCVDGLDNSNTSDDPINLGIIAVNGNPAFLFGNACDESGVEVLTEAFPEDEILNVQLELSGSNPGHPLELRGCIFDADTILQDGQASASYLAGILIGSPAELLASEPPTRAISISATISTQDGVEDGDFGSIILRAVGLIPPEDIEDLVTNPADAETRIFVTLEFQSVGIKPGTEVTFAISREDLGELFGPGGQVGSMVTDVVSGTEEAGTVPVQYTTFNNTGGTQVLTATIILPNPIDFDPACPDVPEAQRTIQVAVVITQSVPEPSPSPTPTPMP